MDKNFGAVNGIIFLNANVDTEYYNGGTYSVKAELNDILYKTQAFTNRGEFDYSISNQQWGELELGQYTIKITATKGDLISIRTFQFAKNSKNISLTSPMTTDMGKVSKRFSIPYTAIASGMTDDCEILIYLDGSLRHRYSFMGKIDSQYNMEHNTFDLMPNGPHRIKIEATNLNKGDKESITWGFVKVGDRIDIQSMPIETTGMPDKVWLRITDKLPKICNYTIRVCNNAMDKTPAWEDMTSEFLSGKPYNIKNKTKEKNNWAIMVRIVLDKDIAQDPAYIYGFGFAFNVNGEIKTHMEVF